MKLLLSLFFLVSFLQLSYRNILATAQATDDNDIEVESVDAVHIEDDLLSETDLKSTEPLDTEQVTKSDIKTVILFTNPSIRTTPMELIADKPVELLIGFFNEAVNDDFIVEMIEASFRYPLDYNYVIQNLTNNVLHVSVPANTNFTFDYRFKPLEGFIGRQLGLVINLYYRNSVESQFIKTVFNETIKITENEDEFNREMFSLYLLMAGTTFGAIFAAYKYFWASKLSQISNSDVNTKSSTTTNGIDYQWLPKETLRLLNKNKSKLQKSPKIPKSPKSPKQKKIK